MSSDTDEHDPQQSVQAHAEDEPDSFQQPEEENHAEFPPESNDAEQTTSEQSISDEQAESLNEQSNDQSIDDNNVESQLVASPRIREQLDDLIDEPTSDNQIEQSTEPTTEQTIDQSTEQSNEQSVTQTVEQSTNEIVSQSTVDQSVEPLEPSSPSFVVEHRHMDTQTLESSESPSDDHSPHSTASTPRDQSSSEESTTIVAVRSVVPLPPRQCTMMVTTDEGIVNVEIQRDYLASKRSFLGGYRGHKTGRITLHAATQTARRRTKPMVEKSERTTQTVATLDRAQQTLKSVATQMDRRDWCPVNDPTAFTPIYIEPRPAVSAETIEALRDSNARAIQCWLRVCFAHRRKAQLQQARNEAQAIAEAESSAVIARRHQQQQAQIERRMHPQSAADFALLQSELQAWRHHETHRIQSLQLDDEEKDRQLATLLSKEVKLLQTIDRLKLAAAKQRKAREVTERLTAMSSPLEWSSSAHGSKVAVVTPNIERAKAMVDLYRALQLPLRIDRNRSVNKEPQEESKEDIQQSEVVQKGSITWEDRLDILLHVKYTAKEQLHTGSKVYVGELVKLIEREEEWMTRRMLSPAIERVNEQGQCVIMDGTRTRIAGLFLQLINDPTFNPHVAQFPTR